MIVSEVARSNRSRSNVVRLPFPSLFPHHTKVAPTSLRLNREPQQIEIEFHAATGDSPEIYNLFLLDHIRSPTDAFAWWCKQYDSSLDRRVARYNARLEAAKSESRRHRIRKRIAELLDVHQKNRRYSHHLD